MALGIAAIAIAVALSLSARAGRETAGAALGGDAPRARAATLIPPLTERIAASWVDRTDGTGLFVDPITGGNRHGYGPAMMAEVMIRDGARRSDRRTLLAGLRALAANSSRAATDGVAGNPLELLAIASAYRWAEGHLAGDADWRRFREAPRRYLRTWESAEVGIRAQRCFAAPDCWSNYKIVDAAAVLLLLATRLEPASDASPLAQRERARADALSILNRDLPAAIGRDATARGPAGTLTGLGLLSDQPTFPLAYHAMSVAALARALEVLGDAAPPTAREHFRRAMLAQASFMAPDGDVAYMGRAQGESWALAAAAYAGESCAGMLRASHPRSAGICATLALRAVKRLKRMHGFRDGLFAIVPRFANGPLTESGLEHYARVMTFNGLTAVFLAWAADAARDSRAVAPHPLPLDGGGSFVDRDRSRMVVVRRGRVWLAVHAVGFDGLPDPRYDLGLVALKLRRHDRWVDVMAPRPFAEELPADTAGPALVTPGGLAPPRGRGFSVDADSGEVVVRVGYRLPGAAEDLQRAQFSYMPAARGVRLTVTAPPGSVLRFQDFLPEPWTEVVDGGTALRTPTASSRLSVASAAVELGTPAPSAYARELVGFRRYVTVPADGRVSCWITARPQR